MQRASVHVCTNTSSHFMNGCYTPPPIPLSWQRPIYFNSYKPRVLHGMTSSAPSTSLMLSLWYTYKILNKCSLQFNNSGEVFFPLQMTLSWRLNISVIFLLTISILQVLLPQLGFDLRTRHDLQKGQIISVYKTKTNLRFFITSHNCIAR